ncbi:MAG: hypothetical protein FJ137_05635 [Deltaproteobacteria bacterium]|nr:hypothetical protein [Deltaproteobacteria bacterium]
MTRDPRRWTGPRASRCAAAWALVSWCATTGAHAEDTAASVIGPAATTTPTSATTATTAPAATAAPSSLAPSTQSATDTTAASSASSTANLTATSEDLPSTRTPLPLLQERFVGVASRAVRFDWRSRSGMVALVGSELIERNNFASVRLGVMGRKAVGDLVVEGAVLWADSFSTSGSELIALTPYRQAGRPLRVELEANVAYPLAEASTTASLWFLPPAEIVISAVAGGRYLLYPQLFFAERPPSDLPFGVDTAISVVSPVLSDSDVVVLERDAVAGMAIDRARVQTLVGLGTDVYFPPGLFVSPRALLALPLLAPVSSTSIGWWWELGAVVGFTW